jgi:hypothetical protein
MWNGADFFLRTCVIGEMLLTSRIVMFFVPRAMWVNVEPN